LANVSTASVLAGDAFEQHVPLGEQTDEHPFDELVLADDDALDLEDRPLQRVHLVLQATIGLRGARLRGRGMRTGGVALSRDLPGISSSALRRSTR